MWTYEQRTGFLLAPGGMRLYPPGYAGREAGKNNPTMQNVQDIGPLPQGLYTIGNPYENPKTGPYTMNLVPDPENEMFGRADFRIHGDSIDEPGTASDGCIVQSHDNRVRVGESPDRRLQVVSGEGVADGGSADSGRAAPVV